MPIQSVFRNGISSLSTTLWLTIAMVIVYLDGALGVTTKSSSASTTEAAAEVKDNSGMIKGMAAGFSGFFAILAVVCILWCCCCTDEDSSARCCCKKKKHSGKKCPAGKVKAVDKSKIAPSPPQSGTVWSRST